MVVEGDGVGRVSRTWTRRCSAPATTKKVMKNEKVVFFDLERARGIFPPSTRYAF